MSPWDGPSGARGLTPATQSCGVIFDTCAPHAAYEWLEAPYVGRYGEAFDPEHPYRIPELLTTAGDLSMTPRGFAAYVRQHLRGLCGIDRHLASASYRRIHFRRRGFSFGVANGVLGGKRYSGLDGSAGTFFCRAVLVPEADFALTVMTNAGSGSGSMKAVEWLTLAMVKRRFGWWWRFWL